MKTDLFLLILFFFLQIFPVSNIQGQPNTIKIEKITDATIDNEGNIYVSTKQGIIKKYDSLFNELFTFASDDIIPLTSIYVSFQFRIFGFYQFNQSYLILDRYFKPLYHTVLDPETIGNATAAAYASDNSLWIFDESDFSLKKINPVLNQLEIHIKMPLLIADDEYSIFQIIAYQNRIYIHNYMYGIYVFDQFGNYLKKLPVQTKSKFAFYRDGLIFIEDTFLKSINIYSNQSTRIGIIPDAKDVLKVICYNDNFYLIYTDSITLYN